MIQASPVGLIKRFIARIASESLIEEMRIYEPEKLTALAARSANPPKDWPWYDTEKSAEFWKTYRRMAARPGFGNYAQQ